MLFSRAAQTSEPAPQIRITSTTSPPVKPPWRSLAEGHFHQPDASPSRSAETASIAPPTQTPAFPDACFSTETSHPAAAASEDPVKDRDLIPRLHQRAYLSRAQAPWAGAAHWFRSHPWPAPDCMDSAPVANRGSARSPEFCVYPGGGKLRTGGGATAAAAERRRAASGSTSRRQSAAPASLVEAEAREILQSKQHAQGDERDGSADGADHG